jgi:hypothetical protein
VILGATAGLGLEAIWIILFYLRRKTGTRLDRTGAKTTF